MESDNLADVTRAKQRMRRAILESRLSRSPRERSSASLMMCNRATMLCRELGAHVVASFLPFRGEPDLAPLHGAIVHHGGTVLLPRTAGGTLTWVVDDGGARERGFGGVPQPVATARGVPISRASLILAPAAAVDLGGTRLGWGGGYYDRLMAHLPQGAPVFAVIYDSDVVDEVPRLCHDGRVSGAITEHRTIRFATK